MSKVKLGNLFNHNLSSGLHGYLHKWENQVITPSFLFFSLLCTKYAEMPPIDLSTTSLWIDRALTYSILQKHQCSHSVFFVDCLAAPLALLVFAGAFSCTLHCKALQGLLIPRPSLERQPGIDRIMGLNDSLGHCSEEGCWLQKHIQWRWVNSQVLAFPLLFLALFFLCQTKVDAFLVSVPCQKNRFPPETSALITLTTSLKPDESSIRVSNIVCCLRIQMKDKGKKIKCIIIQIMHLDLVFW